MWNSCANRWSFKWDHAKQYLYYYLFIPAHYIWAAHGEGSMSSYEYGSLSSIAMEDNLNFRGIVYGVGGPNFEATHQSSYDHEFTNEQPNPNKRTFYDLLSQDDQ